MMEWWASLEGALQIFYAIAIGSSLVLILQFVMTLVGMGAGGMDIDAPGGIDLPDGVDLPQGDLDIDSAGIGLLSSRTILAFFVGFGWAGVIALHSSGSLFPSLVIALVFGVIFMLVVFKMLSAIASLAESGNIDIRNAVGRTATVYTPIPPRRAGHGQIQVVVQGRLREFPAVTDEEAALSTGSDIRVVEVLGGGTMLVRRMEESS